MNYKRVAKCLGGLSFGGLSVVFALANLPHFPEVKKPFIDDAHKTITLANRDMMELSIQALQLKNEGLGVKKRVSDPVFCERALHYIAWAEQNIIHLNDMVIAGTVQSWLWNRDTYPWTKVEEDRAHTEATGQGVQDDLNAVSDACKQYAPSPKNYK